MNSRNESWAALEETHYNKQTNIVDKTITIYLHTIRNV